jgi:hypothetical protein
MGMTARAHKIVVLRVDIGVRDGGCVGSSDASNDSGIGTGGGRNGRYETKEGADELSLCQTVNVWRGTVVIC